MTPSSPPSRLGAVLSVTFLLLASRVLADDAIDTTNYHSTRDLFSGFQELAAKGCQLQLLAHCAGESEDCIPSVRLFSSARPAKHRALLLFGEHARELITTETALQLASLLCFPAEEDPELASAVRRLRASAELLLFPAVNLQGRLRVERNGDYCLRVNKNGVDLNRNWAEHFAPPSSSADEAQVNPGSSPFSEPETRVLRDTAHEFRPDVFVSVHSGSLGMFTPPAFSAEVRGRSLRVVFLFFVL